MERGEIMKRYVIALVFLFLGLGCYHAEEDVCDEADDVPSACDECCVGELNNCLCGRITEQVRNGELRDVCQCNCGEDPSWCYED